MSACQISRYFALEMNAKTLFAVILGILGFAWPLVLELPGLTLANSLARRISGLPEEFRDAVLKLQADDQDLGPPLQAHEMGTRLRALELSSNRIEKLVTSLCNVGRPYDSEMRPTSIPDGIADTLATLENRLKRYRLRLDIPEALPNALGNASELNQIWTNLLVNAMDATPEDGELAIRVSSHESGITVVFEDTGTGIDSDAIDRIFETNFTTKKGGGSFGLGLGLSISKEIAESHGGSIRAENRPSGGARFIVTLPLAR